MKITYETPVLKTKNLMQCTIGEVIQVKGHNAPYMIVSQDIITDNEDENDKYDYDECTDVWNGRTLVVNLESGNLVTFRNATEVFPVNYAMKVNS